VIDSVSTFPIDFFLLMGKNYIGNDTLGREAHGLRKAFDLNILRSENPNLLHNFYRSLAKMGLGREIVLYARLDTQI